MARLAEFHWRTLEPTAIDEELVLYDDGTAWLVVRRPREVSPAIGSYRCRPSREDAAALAAASRGAVVISLATPGDQPFAALFPVLDRVCALARQTPEAIANFYGRAMAPPAGGSVTLALVVVGAGERAVQFELDPARSAVQFTRSGHVVQAAAFPELQSGLAGPNAEGIGGLRRVAILDPGRHGAVSFALPAPEEADGVVLQVAGWLRAALPDEPMPERFEVLTEEAPLGTRAGS